MSFRRNRQPDLEWKRWTQAHEDRLTAIGLPREVWADRLTWQRFLGEGFHADPETSGLCVRFRLEDLNEQQQRLLYELLCEFFAASDPAGCIVWSLLHRRFAPTEAAFPDPPPDDA